MGLICVTPPAIEPVSLADMKLHLRVDNDSDDTLISALITAAREYCENYTRRQFVTATYDLKMDFFAGDDPSLPRPYVNYWNNQYWNRGVIEIPKPRLQSVTSITYTDPSSVSQTVDSSNYVVDVSQEPGRICLAANSFWPDTLAQANAVTIRFVAGYGDLATNVPASICQAMKIICGQWYENRQITIEKRISEITGTASVDALLWAHRVLTWGS